jgi:molecular chaperone GrpE
MFQRAAAEFDNYKKRTVREKEALYSDAVSDVISAFLPVIDNLERAILSADSNSADAKSIREGIELVIKQVTETLKNLDVKVIKSTGEAFDPQLHNAVMHIEDESLEQNIIAEEFQKGYIYKDKVIRHSMVKVAN